MPDQKLRIEVQGDYLQKLATGRPISALSELIWNAVDADATNVDVDIISDDMGMQSISVRDNGHGIPHDEITQLFGRLGGSWKAQSSAPKTASRMLHGKEGKGRFKALALGRVADWTIVYKQNGKYYEYCVTLIEDDLRSAKVSEPQESSKTQTGVFVQITELHRDFKSLSSETTTQEFSAVFALYLSAYPQVKISLNSERLDPKQAISSHKKFDLKPIQEGSEEFPCALELIEWNKPTERAIYLCTENGFPLVREQSKFHTAGFQFSAYLQSGFISKLSKEGTLGLADLNPALQQSLDEAQDKIKAYFRDRETEDARSEIEQWKSDAVYPYKEEPETEIEHAERKVFDIVALNINKHLPDFSSSNKKAKAFQLRMVRQAIESGPEELQHILTEVLNLPEQKRKELSKLLNKTSLTNIIGASKMVADRLGFLRGLEQVLFDPDYKSKLKERSQLHRMIADNNTWIFGEGFALTVDDKSLTEVLRKHKKTIGKDTVIDKPVTTVNGKMGIVDLMLSRSVPTPRSEEREHLVIELKRPTVKIGSEEISQIKKYAFAIAEDERFASTSTKWTFMVISNDLTADGKREAHQSDRPNGQIFKGDNVEIWCKTWGEVLDAARSRIKFVQDHLKADISNDDAIRFLQDTYAKYLEGVIVESDKSPIPNKADDADQGITPQG